MYRKKQLLLLQINSLYSLRKSSLFFKGGMGYCTANALVEKQRVLRENNFVNCI